MSISPADVDSYADTMHTDLARIAEALERFAEMFERYLEHEHFVNVKQYGAWITREDRE